MIYLFIILDVWLQPLVARVRGEPFGLFCPAFTDELIRREATQGLEPACVVVGGDEVGQVRLELSVIVVVFTLDGGLIDGPVHLLDVSIGSRMPDLGKPVFDAVLAATHVEHIGRVAGGGPLAVAWRVCNAGHDPASDGLLAPPPDVHGTFNARRSRTLIQLVSSAPITQHVRPSHNRPVPRHADGHKHLPHLQPWRIALNALSFCSNGGLSPLRASKE